MCGRYRLSRRKQLVEGYFNSVSEEEEWRPRYNLTAVGQNRRRSLALLLLVAFALSSNLAYAHAILVEASPSANSTVAGPSIPIKLRFSVRIDAKRSRLELIGPDKTLTLLSATQPSPDTLQAVAEGLKAGSYSCDGRSWQRTGTLRGVRFPST
jgi:methionine-rich copper-binding protein CopC